MTVAIATFDQFREAAENADLVPLWTAVHFDHETSISLTERFLDEPYLFLLESATSGPASIARYSYIGFDPVWRWWREDNRTFVDFGTGPNPDSNEDKDPLSSLRSQMQALRFQAPKVSSQQFRGEDLTASGGATGYLGYDIAADLEPSIGEVPPADNKFPLAHFFLPGSLLVLDHFSRQLHLIRYVRIEDHSEAGLKKHFAQGNLALRHLQQTIESSHRPPALRTSSRPLEDTRWTGSFEKQQFFTCVEDCLEQIRAGEIFQIQVGNRVRVPTKARPFDIFRHLRILNPSPYMFFYKLQDQHVLGASPEMMVGVQGRTMTHRPIAGTRKRTWDVTKDQRMQHELETSEKERAEHVMLVDLSRNDIGRIAAPGTVKVEELMVVERYSHVFHLVSQVTGQLADGNDAFDAMRVSFPNGTVSGAPKIRAMELIYTYESVRRDFYAGSLGVFDFSGDLKSTLLIRSLVLHDEVATTQASAGIVYDSVPAEEWLETRNKMAACLTAIQNTDPP